MGPRVLIIDQSKVVQLILRASLRRAGIESVAYDDEQEVFSALREEPELDPEVVLLEAELPAIDGYSLVPLLKAQTRLWHCTFIVLTRHAGVMQQVKRRLAGAAGYVAKPFDTKRVVALVQEYLAAPPKQGAKAAASRTARTTTPY